MHNPSSLFNQNYAYIIGISKYSRLNPLTSAANDATELSRLLREIHQYDSVQTFLDEQATGAELRRLLIEQLPREVRTNDRVLFYFAGHGLPLPGDSGPEGYLAPQDGAAEDVTTLLSMQTLYQAFIDLPCRHLLVILDCCFAGMFRWSFLRHANPARGPLYREQYDRYVARRAWQVLTSAAADEPAADILSKREVVTLATLGMDTRGSEEHSPFALQLFAALSGAERVSPPPGDGVITANRLYSFLRDQLERNTPAGFRIQTPGLWPLPRHDDGEYIFTIPGKSGAADLTPAPRLDEQTNPYRGLQPFVTADQGLFFGRDALIEELTPQVVKQPLTVVVGASGAGKSSLVAAGLIPRLRKLAWTVLEPVRPGGEPTQMLANLDTLPAGSALTARVQAWHQAHPTQQLALVIDQFEEVLTLCRSQDDRTHFLEELAGALQAVTPNFHLVLTLRSEFEPQFTSADAPLAAHWKRFIVRMMTQDELRMVIKGPAAEKALVFDQESLVESLVNEVIQMPGGLPLLSFTLSELYLCYLEHVRKEDERGRTRTLSTVDYEAIGRVIGALQKRADSIWASLGTADEQQTMQFVMQRMVALEGGERTRRPVLRDELKYAVAATAPENLRVQKVLQALEAARLIISDNNLSGQPYVELAHDALIMSWKRFVAWTENPNLLLLQRALTDAAITWMQNGRSPGSLWEDDPRLGLLDPANQARLIESNAAEDRRPRPVQRMRNWIAAAVLPVPQQSYAWVNHLEGEFIRASRQRHQANQRGALRIAAILIVLTLGALIGAYLAELNRQQANREARHALAEALSASSVAQLTVDPERSILLALEAVATTQQVREPVLPQAEEALHQALLESHIRWTIQDPTDAVNAGAWSPDGRFLATASNNRVQVWSSETRQPTFTLGAHRGHVTSVSWSPSGQWLLTSAEADPNLHIWDAATGQEAYALPVATTGILQAAWSHDGKTILVRTSTGTAAIWDTVMRKQVYALPASVRFATWRRDEQAIATVNSDGTVSLWNRTTGQPTNIATALDPTVLAWSPDGQALALANARNEIEIIDIPSGREHVPLQGHSGSILSLVWSADGKTLLSAGEDGTARIWDVATLQQVVILRGHRDIVYSATWRGDAQYILTVSQDRTARVWDIRPGQEAPTLGGQGGAITALAYDPATYTVAAMDQENRLHLWNAVNATERYRSPALATAVEQIAWSPDGRLLATGDDDGTLRIWDGQSGQVVHQWKPHADAVRSVQWSRDGQAVLTASMDNTVKITQIPGGASRSLPRPHVLVQCAAWSPDGKWIATAGGDVVTQDGGDPGVRSIIKIWDGTGQTPVRTLQVAADGNNDFVQILWSPDGRYMVGTNTDGTARVWEVATGQLLTVFRGHVGPVSQAAWSPDGQQLVTVGHDGSAQVWEALSGRVNMALHGHSGPVSQVVWSTDGNRILTAGNDGTVRQYRMDLASLLSLAAAHVTRSLTAEERATYLLPGLSGGAAPP